MSSDAREYARKSSDRCSRRASPFVLRRSRDVTQADASSLQGKKNVEVRPAHTNKGEIVQRLLYLYPDSEFVICAGDDKTDEVSGRLISGENES